MAESASSGGNGYVARHPVVVFIAAVFPCSALFQAFGAELAGGWAQWGDGILWYRASCVVNDLALAGGAYLGTRFLSGPLWWRHNYLFSWSSFFGFCAAGGLYLMVLSRRLALLYGSEVPPMATGWLFVWQRAFVPLLLLLWVRRRFRAGCSQVPRTQT